jgi:hypothetical protein
MGERTKVCSEDTARPSTAQHSTSNAFDKGRGRGSLETVFFISCLFLLFLLLHVLGGYFFLWGSYFKTCFEKIKTIRETKAAIINGTSLLSLKCPTLVGISCQVSSSNSFPYSCMISN